MRILITGAGGFMGSHLVDYLSNGNNTITTVDNFSTGFRSNLIKKINVHNYEVDLLDKKQLEAIIIKEKPEVVYHLAAWAHEGLSQFSPLKVTENNLNITLNVLVLSIKHGMKKFVFTSSMSVYGDGKPPFSEEAQRNPVDIYGNAKTACERAIEILSKVHGYEYTILRPHNVYGPRQNLSDPYRNVVGIFIRRSIENKPLIVYGDGEQTRSFTFIDDITPIIAKAGDLSIANGEIINIGPTKNFSINKLANTIRSISKNNITIEHIPDRPLEVKHAFCTNDKAKRLLEYKTNTVFTDGIIKTMAWANVLDATTGIAKPKYLDDLEIITKNTPQTWIKKTL